MPHRPNFSNLASLRVSDFSYNGARFANEIGDFAEDQSAIGYTGWLIQQLLNGKDNNTAKVIDMA